MVRLFCLPYAGGGASRYFTWTRYFPQEIDVCPVQLPGREARLHEPAFTDVQTLVYAVAEAVLPALDRPFAIFGHSMGALLGFELARCLRRELGLVPLHFFASGARAPHLPVVEEGLHTLPDSQFVQRVGRLDPSTAPLLANPEYVELLLPAIRADFTICGTYAHYPEAPLECPISAFGGQDDGSVSLEQLSAWDLHTAQSLLVRLFAGGHLFLNDCGRDLAGLVHGDLMASYHERR